MSEPMTCAWCGREGAVTRTAPDGVVWPFHLECFDEVMEIDFPVALPNPLAKAKEGGR